MILKRDLLQSYVIKRMSVSEISKKFDKSQGQINYWLSKYGISKRSKSDAAYQKWNPDGDPFNEVEIKTMNDAFIFGIGIGLYWGEGTKKSLHSVRLANSDPNLVRMFILFLRTIFQVESRKIKFGLQIFGDMSPRQALAFWSKELGFSKGHFQKPVVTPYRGVGNYREKTKYGVVTVYFNNKKLRDRLVLAIRSADGIRFK